MSYTPTVWNENDLITADKLNNLEIGVKETPSFLDFGEVELQSIENIENEEIDINSQLKDVLGETYKNNAESYFIKDVSSFYPFSELMAKSSDEDISQEEATALLQKMYKIPGFCIRRSAPSASAGDAVFAYFSYYFSQTDYPWHFEPITLDRLNTSLQDFCFKGHAFITMQPVSSGTYSFYLAGIKEKSAPIDLKEASDFLKFCDLGTLTLNEIAPGKDVHFFKIYNKENNISTSIPIYDSFATELEDYKVTLNWNHSNISNYGYVRLRIRENSSSRPKEYVLYNKGGGDAEYMGTATYTFSHSFISPAGTSTSSSSTEEQEDCLLIENFTFIVQSNSHYLGETLKEVTYFQNDSACMYTALLSGKLIYNSYTIPLTNLTT